MSIAYKKNDYDGSSLLRDAHEENSLSVKGSDRKGKSMAELLFEDEQYRKKMSACYSIFKALRGRYGLFTSRNFTPEDVRRFLAIYDSTYNE